MTTPTPLPQPSPLSSLSPLRDLFFLLQQLSLSSCYTPSPARLPILPWALSPLATESAIEGATRSATSGRQDRQRVDNRRGDGSTTGGATGLPERREGQRKWRDAMWTTGDNRKGDGKTARMTTTSSRRAWGTSGQQEWVGWGENRRILR